MRAETTMTSRRRHPAQASRILATGLSAATLLGIVAVLGAQPPAGAPEEPAGIAPARVTVVIGDPGAKPPSARQATARQTARQATARRPDTSSRPS
jgi:hypothetical protein